MTSGLSAKLLSPNHSLISKLKRQARRIYRQSPRRVVLVAGLTVLKASVILYWALPFLCPNTCVLRRIPALHSFFPELRNGAQLPKQVCSLHAHVMRLSMTGCHCAYRPGAPVHPSGEGREPPAGVHRKAAPLSGPCRPEQQRPAPGQRCAHATPPVAAVAGGVLGFMLPGVFPCRCDQQRGGVEGH